MRRIFGIALVVMCALTTEAAPGRDDKKEPDKRTPDKNGLPAGAYTIIEIEVGGNPIPKDILAKATAAERTLTITPGTITATKGGKDDPAAYTIYPAEKPPQIDMTAKRAGAKDDTMRGIYKVDGDTLVICLVTADKDRPKDFKTAPNSQAIMMTLKRNAAPPKKEK